MLGAIWILSVTGLLVFVFVMWAFVPKYVCYVCGWSTQDRADLTNKRTRCPKCMSSIVLIKR